MIVAVDFDNTISRDPHTLLKVMETFEIVGHSCIVVTYRRPDTYPGDLDFLREKGYKVYCTSQQAKKHFMADLGIYPDIWIDDEPETIVLNYNPRNSQWSWHERCSIKKSMKPST